jgi:glycosyltransferase involved in cell wall biosynthesis
VNDIQLQWLYQNCFAFVFPAFAEGFGLPVLEAMSLGVAVIASNTTSLPEVVGDAGILVDPEDIESISVHMQDLYKGKENREKYKSLANARAQGFSWEKTAEQVLRIYTHIFRDK